MSPALTLLLVVLAAAFVAVALPAIRRADRALDAGRFGTFLLEGLRAILAFAAGVVLVILAFGRRA